MLNGIVASFVISLFIVISHCLGQAHAQSTPPIPNISEYDSIYPALSVDDVIRQAVAGNVLAQHELSSRLARGEGVPLNTSAAARWYSLAVSRGFPGAPSLDTLRNYPVRARVATPGNVDNPPAARLTVTSHNDALVATVDASASSAASSIIRYIWSVEPADGGTTIAPPGNLQTTQISLPEAGLYYITVAVLDEKGHIGYASEALSITAPPEPEIPSTPILLAPSSGSNIADGETIDFVWERSSAATMYSYELFPTNSQANNPLTAAYLPDSSCVDDLCTLAILFDFGIYGPLTWRVSASNDTVSSDWASDQVTALPPLPTVPVPVMPLPNTLLETDTLAEFSWNPVDNASSYRWELVDTQDAALSTPVAIVPADNCSVEICSLAVNLDLPAGNSYQWQVHAENAAGISDWSITPIQIVAKATTLPLPPTLLSPDANAHVSQSDVIDFTWTQDSHAVTWEFQFLDTVTPLTLPAVTDLRTADICSDGACVLSLSVDLPVGESHAWRVRGQNSIGVSDSQNDHHFGDCHRPPWNV